MDADDVPDTHPERGTGDRAVVRPRVPDDASLEADLGALRREPELPHALGRGPRNSGEDDCDTEEEGEHEGDHDHRPTPLNRSRLHDEPQPFPPARREECSVCTSRKRTYADGYALSS